MERIEIGGMSVAFERSGDGPPLLLLHGFLSDSTAWRRQLASLSADFTVVAWDAPGCGASSDPPASSRMPEYADWLAAFIETLGLEQPHVLGLSFGAAMALELYRRHPALPRTLVLASAYAGWAGSLPAPVVAERLAQSLRESKLPPEQWVRGWIPGWLTERAPPEMVEEMVTMMSRFHPAGFRTMVHALAEADLRDVLPRIEIPTLLVHGAEDRRSPISVAEDLHAAIRGSTLVVIPAAGHLANVEAAEPFNRAVRDFLLSR